MRIGITGAQSVGKTTLLNALRSEVFFNEYAICDEVTRRVASYGLPINENGNDSTQRIIMNEHIVNIFMHEKMLTDRTALDCLVYSRYLYMEKKISPSTMHYVHNAFLKLWKEYDMVFYIEPEFSIVDDGTRSVDQNFRDEIDDLFGNTIKLNKINVIKIKGSVRERVDMVMNYMEKK